HEITWQYNDVGVIGSVHKPTGKLIFKTLGEPYVTDGTTVEILKDIISGYGTTLNSNPRYFSSTNSLVFFSAPTSYNGPEYLWRTDGTPGGTQNISSYAITSPNSVTTTLAGNIADTLIYCSGTSIYRSNGTAGGTTLVKAMGGECISFHSFDNLVAFQCMGGTNYGIWITDGTEAGTIQLNSDSYSSSYLYYDFFKIDDMIYYRKNTDLFQSDGTISGTVKIIDRILDIAKFDNKVFLLKSSVGGESNVTNFYSFSGDIEPMVEIPGTDSLSNFHDLHANGDNLFFHAYEPATGDELYTYNIPSDPTISLRLQNTPNGMQGIVDGSKYDTTNTNLARWEILGEATLDTSFTSKKFVISNSGSNTLTLETPSITGTYAQYFSIQDFPQSIAPFAVDSFNIVFTGNVNDGYQVVEIQIPSNAANSPVFNFEIVGRSISKPQINSFANYYNVYPIDYGLTSTSESKYDTVMIYNSGYGNPVIIDSLVFTGPAKDDYSATVSNSSIKAYNYYTIHDDDKYDSLYNNPNFFSNLIIKFTPTASGERRASLTVYSNDPLPTSSAQTINLSGTGVCMQTDSISPATTDIICLGSGDEVTLTYPSSPNETYCWGTFDEWKHVGLEDFQQAYSTRSELKFDSNNNPVLAFNTFDYNSQTSSISVMKYENDTWNLVGNANFINPVSGASVELEIGENDTLYVAYLNASKKMAVQKFNGTDWVQVGPDGFSDGEADHISMCVANNKVVVAYQDKSIYRRATVKQFDGTSWESLGGTGFSEASATYVDVKTYSNEIYVGMQDGSSTNSGPSLYKFNGNTWDVIGDKGFFDGVIKSLDLEFDSNGNPFVAFMDYDNNNNSKMNVMKYENSTWLNVGDRRFSPSINNDSGYRYPKLTIGNNVPYVAFNNSSAMRVMSFEGGVWDYIGENSLPPGYVQGNYIYAYDLATDNTGVLHCFYNKNAWHNLVAYSNTYDCLGTENTYTTATPGFYKVLVTNTESNCTAKSLNTVEVRVKECFPSLLVRGKGITINNGDDTPSTDDYTNMGTALLDSIITRDFIMVNSGDAKLIVDSIYFSGADSARFSAINPPDSVPQGDSATLTIQYQSSAYEISTTTLILQSNYIYNGGLYYFDLKAITSGLSISQTDSLQTDLNNNGFVDLDDVIRYTAVIENAAGAPALNTMSFRAQGNYGQLVAGSLTTTDGTPAEYSSYFSVAFSSLNP
nr:choice-of-anchor D domain-containing protein [Bacteroidota bacterium]